jgi:hypothetical protein
MFLTIASLLSNFFELEKAYYIPYHGNWNIEEAHQRTFVK